jgi:hypothetical protein
MRLGRAWKIVHAAVEGEPSVANATAIRNHGVTTPLQRFARVGMIGTDEQREIIDG